MVKRNEDLDSQKASTPSASIAKPSVEVIANLQLIAEVFQQIEEETAETADAIFDCLVEVDGEHIMNGTIPYGEDENINKYIKILNRLFSFSRQKNDGGFRLINRHTVEELEKKTFTICMCHDGGVSLDVLCDIVNVENQARTPTASPVKITVTQAFGNTQESELIH